MGPDCVPSSTISVLPQSRKTTSMGVEAGVARLPPARLAGGCRCVSAGLAGPVSAAGSTRRTPSATATPMAQPAATSDGQCTACLLYTSDAADDLLCVDLGGRRIIKKK